MYKIEALSDLISKAVNDSVIRYLDIFTITSDDYLNIIISARKVEHLQDKGSEVSFRYPMLPYYSDADVIKMIANLIAL